MFLVHSHHAASTSGLYALGTMFPGSALCASPLALNSSKFWNAVHVDAAFLVDVFFARRVSRQWARRVSRQGLVARGQLD